MMKENAPCRPGVRRVLTTRLDELVPLFRECLETGRNVWFTPSGVSMQPMLRHGIDSVELSPAPEQLKKYDLPLYQRDDGRYVLHRVVGTGETYTCMGDNQFLPEHMIRREQVIAVVTTFRRGGRVYSVSHPGYRLYCRVWHHSRPVRHFLHRGMGWLRRHWE